MKYFKIENTVYKSFRLLNIIDKKENRYIRISMPVRQINYIVDKLLKPAGYTDKSVVSVKPKVNHTDKEPLYIHKIKTAGLYAGADEMGRYLNRKYDVDFEVVYEGGLSLVVKMENLSFNIHYDVLINTGEEERENLFSSYIALSLSLKGQGRVVYSGLDTVKVINDVM